MRAIILDRFGGPEVLTEQTLDEPQAGLGEIRIRVVAASVTPADLLFRRGGLAERLPDPGSGLVPGTEVAGVVDQAAAGDRFTIGDRVMAVVVPWRQTRGGYAEHVVVPSGSATLVPPDCALTAAAALPMSGLTALSLLEELELGTASTIAICGAAGSVGTLVLQLAKAAGHAVVADASRAARDKVHRLGADVVLDRGDDYASQIREAIPGGVDVMVDCALVGEPLLRGVRDGGTIVSLRSSVLAPPRGIRATGILVWPHAEDHARLDRLSESIRRGAVAPPEVEVFPLADAASAHAVLEGGPRPHRVVLST